MQETMSLSASTTLPLEALKSKGAKSTKNFPCCWGLNGVACTNVFLNPEELFKHVCEHINECKSEPFPFLCRWADCQKKNHRKDHLISHIRVHVPHRPYKCKVCCFCYPLHVQLISPCSYVSFVERPLNAQMTHESTK
jgi:hypothetical protein